MLDPTFNGRNIVPANNVNMAQLDDPKINAAMVRAKLIKSEPLRHAAWGRIDRMITEQGAVIPWLWTNVPNVVSDRIVPAKMLWNVGALDLASTSIE
jgi:peptide/nickel transport system substrate-binding protein